MSTLPASGYIENAARTVAEMKTALEDVRDCIEEHLGGDAESELTISSGSVTPTVGCHSIDTEGDAASDNLDNILQTNHPDGRFLIIHPEDDARTVVVRNAQGGAGQIYTLDGTSVTLENTEEYMILKRTSTSWHEVMRSNPADTTSLGLVELATDAETQALSSDSVVCTPGNLGSLDASTSQKGILETATAAEAQAMSVADKGVTPSNLADVAASGAEMATGTSTTRFATPDAVADLLQYDHIDIPAAAMTPIESAVGATATTVEYSSNHTDLDVLAFDDTEYNRANFGFTFPDGWDRGTVKAKFYWTNDSTASPVASPGDGVVWAIGAVAISNDDAIDSSLGDFRSVTDTVLADGDLHISPATDAITIGGTPAVGDHVVFRVHRIAASGADDMPGDALLIKVRIEYKKTNTVSAW